MSRYYEPELPLEPPEPEVDGVLTCCECEEVIPGDGGTLKSMAITTASDAWRTTNISHHSEGSGTKLETSSILCQVYL